MYYFFVEMKVIELLKLNRELLTICQAAGVRLDDVCYIELYNDYARLLANGEKTSYIVAVLAEKYNVCERKVLTILADHSLVYFTSNKSSILELCEWIGTNKSVGNPFDGCTKAEFNAHMNYNATYTDMMLYKQHVAA